MIYLWSTNPTNIGSKLIQFGGQDRCSHFAKYYPAKGLVVESRIQTGVRTTPYESWINEGNRIIFTIDMPFTSSDEELLALDQPIIGLKYDRLGIFFLTIKTLLFGKFRRNRWASKEDYFCVEVVKTHEHLLANLGIPKRDWANMYPEELYEYLKERL